MKKKRIIKAFNNHCDLTYDVGDENNEDIHVISEECFIEAVNELLSKRKNDTIKFEMLLCCHDKLTTE